MTEKSLDRKLARIHADPSVNDFILADAKDADMAFGLASPGQSPEHHGREGWFRSLEEYRDLMYQNVEQGLLDIMLMSVSSAEILTIEQRLFDNSPVTPAIRANDTTDIHLATGSRYRSQPSRPFRTATIDHAMCGKVDCEPDERETGVDLGLFSMTFNNDIELDLAMLEAYKDFRLEAETKGFRHFLEVFDPNVCGDHCPPDLGRFLADSIVRALAGVTRAARPIFLKIPYHGPDAMEALAGYDRSIIPGILGGAAGTTYDAFHQLLDAKKHGARAALYGRMINNAEDQATFIQHLRWLADGELDDAADAVRSYHGALTKLDVQPRRTLDMDLQATDRQTAYATAASRGNQPATVPRRPPSPDPDFNQMSAAEKVAWNRRRWDRVFPSSGGAKGP